MSSSIDKQQIRDILTAIARVSRGDYDTRLETSGKHTDFDSIAAGFNMMINEIRYRQEDLEEQREEIKALNDSLLRQVAERKQAENLYKTLTENTTTGIYITQHGRFVFFNEVFRKYCGYSSEELLAMNSIDLVHPDDRPAVRKYAIDMLKGARTAGYEFRIINKTGEIVWAIENLTSIEYQGELAVMGNFVNITNRKEAEESLAFSDTILRTINEAIIAMDIDFNITFWNTTAEKLFGITADEAEGKFIGTLIAMAEDDEGQNEERLNVLLEKGYNREEQLYITPKGEVWVDVTIQAIEKDGERIGWVTLASDISERKQLEIISKENEQKFSTVFFANPIPMTIFSVDSQRILDVNLAFERENGYKREDVFDKTMNDISMFVYPEQGEAIARMMQEDGIVENFEAQVRTGTGEERTLLLSANSITIGGLPYFITAANDITEQKRIETKLQETNEQLDSQNYRLKAQTQLLTEQQEELVEKNKEVERANQLKSEFLASMSHELRTPLNAVIGFSELMLDGITGEINDEQSECLSDILNSGKHLLELINDVLDLSKVEAGKMEFKPVELDVSEVIHEAVQTVKALTEQREHTVSVTIEEGIQGIYADKSRLRQVLLNLLSNSTKFTPVGGNLDITAETNDGMCRIGVRDNGIGIKPEDQERIFEVFTQAERIEDDTPKGTGLGLALTRQFMIAMGGTIWVESEYGKGSVFYITIPFASSTQADPSTIEDKKSEESPVSLSSARKVPLVLVVDDDSRARRLTGRWLKEEGFDVLEASGAEEGIQKTEEMLPDLVILDILMPDKDGWYVLRELKSRQQTSNIPVIIASVDDERDMAFSLGAVDYFNKPINKTRFQKRIFELGLDKHDKVLVVDDNPADIRLVSSILEAEGIEVVKATGGKNAIDIILRDKPSLVILDLVMPDLTGFEVIEKLRSTDTMLDIPIIVMTSKDLDTDEMEYLRKQTEGIVRKSSFSREDFIETVRKLMNDEQ
ncbi:MAG: PAS domain S-box protein [Dehalococcoidales bacterium]|nr:PAS domain S-box protein [Dehalococcoidales bacterium]